MSKFVLHPDFPHLKYYPSSGNFRWRVKKNHGRTKKGTIAGYCGKDGYVKMRYDDKVYLAHRVAYLFMMGEWPEHEIDHEDQDPSNNRWSNLFNATRVQNGRNQKKRSTNTSGTMGVYWHKQAKRWIVAIGNEHIGCFSSFDEAVVVRKKTEVERGYHPNHGKNH